MSLRSTKFIYKNLGLDNDSIDLIIDSLKSIKKRLELIIESFDVRRYELKWFPIKKTKYKLKKTQKVIIPKGNSIIKIYERYSERKPILNSQEAQIDFEILEKHSEYFVVKTKYSPHIGEELYYGLRPVKWDYLEKPIEIDQKSVLNDHNGREIKPLNVQKLENEFIVYLLKEDFSSPNTLYLNGIPLNYKIETYNNMPHKLYPFDITKNQKIPNELILKFTSPDEIILEEELKSGFLIDENNNIYGYEKIGEEKWIVLIDDSHNEDDLKIDIFLKLVEGAPEQIILETPTFNKDKTIKVYKVDNEEGALCVERLPNSDKIYPPHNTYQIELQKRAINSLLMNSYIEHIPLLQLFVDQDKAAFPDFYEDYVENWIFLDKEDFEGIEEQRKFVENALATPDFYLLEGPPGSGKTTTIAELAYQLIKRNKRVLLVSSTHVAVDNVLEKLYERFEGKLIENDIVPLRIGLEERVSEMILEFQIKRRIERMKKRIEDIDIKSGLSEDEQQKLVEELVINTSNLVCGTTMGILQYPTFRNQRDNNTMQEFDYMIIDEASKCTLLEFLVPAIHAKRWIIVGDVRQLAPYMETTNISLLISNVMEADESLKRALLIYFAVFYKRKSGKNNFNPPSVIVVESGEVLKKLGYILVDKIQGIKDDRLKESINEAYLFVVRDCLVDDLKDYRKNGKVLTESELMNDIKSIIKLNNSDKFKIIVIEDEVYLKFKTLLPETHIVLTRDALSNFHNYRFLLNFYKQKNPISLATKNGHIDEPEKMIEELYNMLFETNWAEEITWRQKRIQELEFAPDEGTKRRYNYDLFALLPPKGVLSKNPYEIQDIVKFFMPSILQALQKGLLNDWKGIYKTVFSHGLPDNVIKKRLIGLTYQNRMHPDISKLPRQIFYQNEALKDSSYVTKGGRNWNYNEYPSRIYWKHVKGEKVTGNKNPKEADEIIVELQKFVKWAKQQKNKKYMAMILTFHEAQRKLIRDKLREKYPENRKKQSQFKIEDIDVRLYTVDRAQGKEADIVFLGMTLNNRVGFLDSPNRLNVAVTRAKYQLVIVGDLDYFCKQKSSPVLQKLADFIKNEQLKISNFPKQEATCKKN